jgi:hypothetical protein
VQSLNNKRGKNSAYQVDTRNARSELKMMYGATLYDQRDVRVLKAAKIEGIMGTKRKEESELMPTNIFGSFQQSPRGSAAKGSARGSAQHSSRGLVGDIQALGKL